MANVLRHPSLSQFVVQISDQRATPMFGHRTDEFDDLPFRIRQLVHGERHWGHTLKASARTPHVC